MINLLKNLLDFCKANKLLVVLIIVGFVIRYGAARGLHFPFDYDQYEDLFLTKRIIRDLDPVLIGRPIYGDPRLHHGVVYFYYNIIPFVLFAGNPLGVVAWNSIFNVLVAAVIFSLSSKLFNNKLARYLAALVVVFSYQMIQFSSWISSTTITIFTVPLIFLGIWMYIQKKNYGLYLASFFLGISIQAEIFFVYLIPIIFLIYLIYRFTLPDIRTLAKAFLIFLISISTLIYTEIKLNFAGIKTLLSFSDTFDDSEISLINRLEFFVQDVLKTFTLNLFPTKPEWGTYLGILIFGVLIISLIINYKKNNKLFKSELYVLIYLLSPVVMLFFGYHRQPWFLIGMIPAVALVSGYAVSKSRWLVIPFVCLLIYSNISTISEIFENGKGIFYTEESAVLSSQVSVMDYVYSEAKGEPFVINAVSYPLYHNAIWEYNFSWYYKTNSRYLPTWIGGDQIFPYQTLLKPTGNEKYLFMIMDMTVRIPEVHRQTAKDWLQERGEIVSEQDIDGFKVLGIMLL